MDYREKYEQALERARNIRFGNPQSATANTVCEEIFPEIKEGEDERIRKSLIKSYTNQHSANFPTVDGFTREQILAWLEKQGEQKPADKVESKIKKEINWLKSIKEKTQEA